MHYFEVGDKMLSMVVPWGPTILSVALTADNLSMMLGCSSLQQVSNVGDKMLSMVVVNLYIYQENSVVGSLQRWFSLGTYSG